jgi:hypothetical protein
MPRKQTAKKEDGLLSAAARFVGETLGKVVASAGLGPPHQETSAVGVKPSAHKKKVAPTTRTSKPRAKTAVKTVAQKAVAKKTVAKKAVVKKGGAKRIPARKKAPSRGSGAAVSAP